MSPSPARLEYNPIRASALIFLIVASALMAFQANRLVFSPDEGILLEAGERMLHGQKIYVDFFSHLGPGSYWLQELVFRWFGLSLRTARLMVTLDFSLQCALVFWLIAQAGYRVAAWVATLLFFCFEAANPTLLLAGHRWDSAAVSLLSVAFCVHGASTNERRYWAFGGALIACASVCTPSIAWLAVITALATVAPGYRRFFLPYCLGGVLTAAGFATAMAVAGELAPFWRQMRWLAQNYSGVNVTPYGWALGGYNALFRELAGDPIPIRLLLVFVAIISAVLPVASGLGWALAWAVKKGSPLPREMRFTVLYLLASLAGYVLSTYPRPDLSHLTFIAPLGYVLVTLLICTYLAHTARLAILMVMLPCAAMVILQGAVSLAGKPLSTPVGSLSVSDGELPSMRTLLSKVHPGQGLYVHPYLPLFYFLTQASNPTRYSFLGPGMMGPREERTALQELQDAPPQWVLYLPLTRENYLRVFPSATGMPARFNAIDHWLACHYTPLRPPVWVSGYQLLAWRK